MKQGEKQITIFGPVNVDVSAGPVNFEKLQAGSLPTENIQISFGGDALNEAVILRRLGAEVSLVSKVGQDSAGDQLIGFLQKEGISAEKILRDGDSQTSVNIVLVDPQGERFFLTNPRGSMRRIQAADYIPFLEDAADLVCFPGMFVSSLLTITDMEVLFHKAKEKRGRILAADMTKAKNGETLRDLVNLLPLVDFLFPNEEEAALLTGERDAAASARLLTEAGVGCTVIKCGNKGCVIAAGNDCFTLPAYSVSRVADTTGAGDSFTAGFLFALQQGMSLQECGLFANAVASCTVEVFGANQGMRSAEIPMKRFEKLRRRG